ncbi:MAG: hypothetical protein JNK76_08615 [Planctomycetales bacterium]|nr:hypothetical protein [Planctomycetales bacterium]
MTDQAGTIHDVASEGMAWRTLDKAITLEEQRQPSHWTSCKKQRDSGSATYILIDSQTGRSNVLDADACRPHAVVDDRRQRFMRVVKRLDIEDVIISGGICENDIVLSDRVLLPLTALPGFCDQCLRIAHAIQRSGFFVAADSSAVHLERDIKDSNSSLGYILTPVAQQALERITGCFRSNVQFFLPSGNPPSYFARLVGECS